MLALGYNVSVIQVPDAGTFPSGEPYWYWLGGRPAVDFVNTRRERWNRDVETLVDDVDVVRWLVRAGLLAQAVDAPAGLAGEARALREAIDVCIRSAVDAADFPFEAVTRIDDWLVFAGARPHLALTAGGPVLGERPAADSPRRALGMVALDAATMLGTPRELDRIRICGAEDCSARFYDRSPAGRRRWCSMQSCGNLAKVRRHRARAKQTATAPAPAGHTAGPGKDGAAA